MFFSRNFVSRSFCYFQESDKTFYSIFLKFLDEEDLAYHRKYLEVETKRVLYSQ